MKSLLPISLLLNILGIFGLLFLVWWMGGFTNLWSRITNRGLSKQYDLLVDQYANTPLEPCDVLLLGNSLTHYGAWSDWLPEIKVINRGIPGDGIEGLQSRMPGYAEAQPRMVFVMIGINDLAFHNEDWLIKRFPSFIAEIKKVYSASKVVLQSILPINNTVSNTGLSNAAIDQVNQSLREICLNTETEYLDLTASFSDDLGQLKTEFTMDGLHLNGKAYAQWAKRLEQQIQLTLGENRLNDI